LGGGDSFVVKVLVSLIKIGLRLEAAAGRFMERGSSLTTGAAAGVGYGA